MSLPAVPSVEFAGHRLDLRAQQLWRGATAVSLRPRAWDLLLHLLDHAGELIPTEALIDQLWPGRAVTTKALTNRIAELRLALGDNDDPPRIIQTVPRRGYRLVAEVRPTDRPPSPPAPDVALPGTPADAGPVRAAELAQLDAHLQAARTGQRRVVLVGGDPGLGKTWLVEHFAAGTAADGVLVGRGQCLGQASASESFGPWLALLADLAAGPAGDTLAPLLRRCAPSWLLQLPWLLQPGEGAALRSGLAGAGSSRMLREGCALIDALAQQQPLVLVLEDLHWADAASVDLLHFLLRGRAPARLLVLATWRPVDAQLHGHPLAALAQQAAGAGTPLHLLPLAPLDDAQSGRLLRQHLASAMAGGPPIADVHLQRLLPRAQQPAQGNPLLLLATAGHLLAARRLAADDADAALPEAAWHVPDSAATVVPGLLRQVVAARLAALADPDRRLLQAASVVGPSFTPRLLAAALQAAPAPLAQACDALVQRQLFIRALPGGPEGIRHGFLHEAYRQALYDTLDLAERQQMHARVARSIEADAGGDWPAVAARLAAAYERAALPADAARLLERTAEVSLGRFDYRAAVRMLQAALRQLALLPATPAIQADALRMHLLRGNVLQLNRLGHPDAVDDYVAADALARQLDDPRSLVRARLGLCLVQSLQGAVGAAMATGASLVALAEARQPGLAAAAHTYAGIAALSQGSHARAQAHFQQALGLQPEPGVPVFVDLPVLARINLGRTLVELGDADTGLREVQCALARSRQAAHPLDQLQTLYWAADAHRVAGRRDAAAALYAEAVARAETFAQDGYELAARFGLLACGPSQPGRCAQMAALLQQRESLGERWNAAGFELALAEAALADGDLGLCGVALSRGLELQGGDHGTRHLPALQALAQRAALPMDGRAESPA